MIIRQLKIKLGTLNNNTTERIEHREFNQLYLLGGCIFDIEDDFILDL